MSADGSDVRQLTTAWTEDYMDAIPEGEARGNTDPDVSPDGRYVVFTNLSGANQESFILRLDLRTGEVLNLTSLTAGPVPVADAKPRYSPDGSRIAFVSTVGGLTQVFVMDADGTHVRQLTDDDYINLDPCWSPDGRWLAYTSYRGRELIEELEHEGSITARKVPMVDWYLVKLDTRTGEQTVLTGKENSPVFRPVWSPEGSSIAYISGGRSTQPDVFVVATDGRDPHPLQITLLSKEEFVDWR